MKNAALIIGLGLGLVALPLVGQHDRIKLSDTMSSTAASALAWHVEFVKLYEAPEEWGGCTLRIRLKNVEQCFSSWNRFMGLLRPLSSGGFMSSAVQIQEDDVDVPRMTEIDASWVWFALRLEHPEFGEK